MPALESGENIGFSIPSDQDFSVIISIIHFIFLLHILLLMLGIILNKFMIFLDIMNLFVESDSFIDNILHPNVISDKIHTFFLEELNIVQRNIKKPDQNAKSLPFHG